MRAIVAGAVVVMLALAPVVAHAGEAERRKEAQVLFEQAIKQAGSGDSKGALASFQKAYERYPSFRVLYNIGQLCAKSGDPACAVRSYEQYLRDGGADVPAKRRTQVEQDLVGLNRIVGRIVIKTSVEGGEVSVDDRAAGKTPIAEPVRVNGGTHKVRLVYKERSVEQSVDVASGSEASAVLELPPDATPVAPPVVADAPKKDDASPRTTPSSEPPPPRKFPSVAWAVTGALTVGTVVSGITTLNAYADYKNKKNDFPVTRDQLDRAQRSARDLFILTTILGAATIVSLGVAGYLTLAPPPPTKTGLAGMRVAITPMGLAIDGAMP